MKITNKMVVEYLTDCLGYDELMIDELKDNFDGEPLAECLDKQEKEDCINYFL